MKLKLKILLALVFFAICVLALGRLLVQAVRRPFAPARPAAPIPQFATS